MKQIFIKLSIRGIAIVFMQFAVSVQYKPQFVWSWSQIPNNLSVSSLQKRFGDI